MKFSNIETSIAIIENGGSLLKGLRLNIQASWSSTRKIKSTDLTGPIWGGGTYHISTGGQLQKRALPNVLRDAPHQSLLMSPLTSTFKYICT